MSPPDMTIGRLARRRHQHRNHPLLPAPRAARPAAQTRGWRAPLPAGNAGTPALHPARPELGFSLREIGELLKLGDGSRTETRSIAEHRLADIEARLRDLEAMRATLGKLIRSCRDGNQPPCPIIASLERDAD